MIFSGNKVENEVEAYLLGFIYADGSIHNFKGGKYRTLSIGLAEKDKDFLQIICNIFNKELGKKYSLKRQEKTKSYKLTICNSDMNERLMKLGIHNNKTYENNSFVFNNVPNNLKTHFIRGFFDGDGCICYTSRKQYVIGFVSLNKKLLESICNYINNNFNLNIKVRLENNKYARINFGGTRKSKKFLDIIYSNSTIFLKRKYIIYKQIPKDNKKYKYKGLAWYKRNKKIAVFLYIDINNQKKYLGLRDTEIDAVKLYNEGAKRFGKQEQIWNGESNEH